MDLKKITLLSAALLLLVSCGGGSTTGDGGGDGDLESVVAPTLDPSGGTFDEPQAITIATTTEGATIYYTTDGTDPTSSSNEYTEQVTISTDSTIKAIAVKSGMTDSDISSGSYIFHLVPQFAVSMSSGEDYSFYNGVFATDSGVYAVGYVNGDAQFDLGNDKTITGDVLLSHNLLIAKYNTSGVPQWVNSVEPAAGESSYTGVSASGSGVYEVGALGQAGTYYLRDDDDDANDVTAWSTYSGNNFLIVKYNTDGVAQLANTVAGHAGGMGSDAPSSSTAYGVSAVGPSVYVVGEINGTEEFDFGNDIEPQGSSIDNNALIIKYDSYLSALFANTVSGGGGNPSVFKGVSATSDDVYAVGFINGTTAFGFGNSITATGGFAGDNAVIAKYDATGETQWVNSVSGGDDYSRFDAVSVGEDGVYAVGVINGTGTFDFGNDIAVTGIYDGENAVIVKYNADGEAQWAKSLTTTEEETVFRGVSVGEDGIYAVGYIYDTDTFDFGDGITVDGACMPEVKDVVIVQYDADGTTLWAKTASGPDIERAEFNGVSTYNQTVFAIGVLGGVELPLNFGNEIETSGIHASGSILLVGYSE